MLWSCENAGGMSTFFLFATNLVTIWAIFSKGDSGFEWNWGSWISFLHIVISRLRALLYCHPLQFLRQNFEQNFTACSTDVTHTGRDEAQ